MVASISDNFNSYTVGDNLSALAKYTVVTLSGSGVPRIDTHGDHSDGTNVVDMSAAGAAWWAHADQLDSVNHEASLDVWPDRDGDLVNGMIVAVRMQTGTPANAAAITCYTVEATPDATDIFTAVLRRVTAGVATDLATFSPVGPAWSTTNNAFPVVLQAETNGSGNVVLTVTVNGVGQTPYTDSSVDKITTGQYIGGRHDRSTASTNGQPFVDNLSASVLGTSGSGAPSLTRHTAAGSGTATAPATTGSSATTLTRHTAAGAGSTGTEGSSATTLARHTAAGVGSTGTTGSSATTLTRVTAAGAGTTTAPGVTSGSGSPTLTRHTAAGTGSTGTTGTGSPTCTRHTAAGVGTTTSPSASGSGAVTLVRHVAAGSGVITGPSVTGSGTLLLARHSASGVGVGPGTATMTKQRSAVGGMERDVRPSERRSILDLRRITQNKPDITVGVGEPAQAALGDFWFDLTVMKYWNGTEWVEI